MTKHLMKRNSFLSLVKEQLGKKGGDVITRKEIVDLVNKNKIKVPMWLMYGPDSKGFKTGRGQFQLPDFYAEEVQESETTDDVLTETSETVEEIVDNQPVEQ